MSLLSIDNTIERIKVAQVTSPIAVFLEAGCDDGRVNSVFANTTYSKQRIRRGDPLLVGVFSSNDDIKDVLEIITDRVSVSVADLGLKKNKKDSKPVAEMAA